MIQTTPIGVRAVDISTDRAGTTKRSVGLGTVPEETKRILRGATSSLRHTQALAVALIARGDEKSEN